MKFYWFTLVFLLVTTLSYAQPTDTLPQQSTKSVAELMRLLDTEIGISDTQYFAELMGVVPNVGSNSAQLLAAQSVKSHMMPPREANGQGIMESYALASCLEFYINHQKNYKVNLSPDYLLLSLQDKIQFSALQDGLKFLMKNGTVSAAILPYGATAMSSAVYATQKYAIKNYLHLFRADTKARQKIFETRRALMRGHPVVLQLAVDDSFMALKNTRYWTPSANMTASEPTETVIAVGYDEDLEAFELMSFRGASWGNAGYIYIDYEDFGKYVAAGYVLVYR
ncbi:MAG: C1 family peptidase [Bacteroidota bacterium]